MTTPSTSILNTTKKMLGIETDVTVFDTDIIVNINTVFMTLNQLGVGPTSGFSITGATETWEQFLGTITDLEAVKSFMYLKVRMLFDPPSNSALIDTINRQIDEIGWRLNAQAENDIAPIPVEGEVDDGD